MDEFFIDVKGLDANELALARFGALIADLRPFWPKLSRLFISWMREQFESEGEFGGDAWEELSPQYLAWKSRRFPSRGILVATGQLRQAASRPKRRPTATSLTLTIKNPTIDWHQKGTTNMPARPLLFEVLPVSARAQVELAAHEYVEEALRISGLGR